MNTPNPTLYVKNIDWKIKKALLRRALYSLFSRHGKVLDIVTLRRDGLRGQAFIIMADVQSATAAMAAEQGFTFFGKDMVISYAKAKSDIIAKRDGDYVPKAKRQKNVEAAKASEDAVVSEQATESATTKATTPPLDTTGEPPSHILLAKDLPTECNEMMLVMLFQQYTGYKEVRMPRSGLAFVEFEDEPQATIALKALHGFKLTPKDSLALSYGKA